jgi:N-acetylneuraminic acid mutarotase
MPFARAEIAVAEHGGKVYIMTGQSPGVEANGFIQEYDPASGNWRDLSFMPTVASHAGAAVLNDKIYLVGGFVANVHVGAVARVFEYDPAADSWRAVAPLAAPRGSAGVVALNGKIHAIGGRDPALNVVATHEIYDPATDSWSYAAPLPVGRDHLGIAVIDGLIHVFGGRTGASVALVGNHDVYDPATDVWTSAAPLLTPRSAGVGLAMDGRIIYAGGECKDATTSPRLTFDEAELYDPASDTWEALPPMPQGIHAAAGIVVGEEALFIGGNGGCGGELPQNQILALTFP